MSASNFNRTSRRSLLSAAAVAGVGAAAGTLTGCSGGDSGKSDFEKKMKNPPDNFNQKGHPIVDKPITIQFMTGRFAENAKDFNTVASWKKYQKLSNIKVDWGPVPKDDVAKKVNLALDSGDYPEAFYISGLDYGAVGKYGSQGILVSWNELIDKYMPNFQKVLKDSPDVKAGLTFPDGNIYSLPRVLDPESTALHVSNRPWVRGDWLDKLDMDVPTTTEEYYRYLKAVKAKQFNGHGETIPFGGGAPGQSGPMSHLRNNLAGSFGVANRGTGGGHIIDVEPSDHATVRFWPTTDAYKALIEYLHRLYSDGLIQKNIFSVDATKVATGLANGVYGSTMDQAPFTKFHGKAKGFVPMPALKGPDGHHKFNAVAGGFTSPSGFLMTDKSNHPAQIARWVDYFYSAAGCKLMHYGVKGVSYKETKDGPEYLDKITHNKKGSPNEAKKPYVTYMGSGYPVLVIGKYFSGNEMSDEGLKAVKVLEPDLQKDVWGRFTFTQDETEKLNSVGSDIEKYVDESFARLVTGDIPISNWNKYVEKLKKMGLEDYLKIQQDAYDRYRKNK